VSEVRRFEMLCIRRFVTNTHVALPGTRIVADAKSAAELLRTGHARLLNDADLPAVAAAAIPLNHTGFTR
jgi:hypothetical protein